MRSPHMPHFSQLEIGLHRRVHHDARGSADYSTKLDFRL